MVMQCVACEGYGCSECGDTGQIELTGCPKDLAGEEVWQVLELAEFFEKGLPPVPGGVLDQAACFVAAARIVWGEQQFWKHKLGILNG